MRDQRTEKRGTKMRYEDLQVYQRSYKASMVMYKLTQRFPSDETYGLISQIKRASTSIPLNIAEGYGRRDSESEFRHFLRTAIGSCYEMKVLVEMSKDLGFINEVQYERMYNEYEEIAKMLYKLRSNWVSYK